MVGLRNMLGDAESSHGYPEFLAELHGEAQSVHACIEKRRRVHCPEDMARSLAIYSVLNYLGKYNFDAEGSTGVSVKKASQY